MKKLFYLILFIPFGLFAQTPEADELVLIQEVATTADMEGITGVVQGSLIFNVEESAIYYYDGTQWINTRRTSFSGTFTISENQVANLANQNQTTTALDINVTVVPFRPSRVEFVAYANVDVVNLSDDNSTGNNNNNTKENTFGYMSGFAQLEADGSITQQVISGGGSANSINDITRFASNLACIGIRYANQNGDQRGLTTASFVEFTDNGFTIQSNRRDDALLVIYTAYQ